MRNEVTLLNTCAGLNNLDDFSAKVNYETGASELSYCDGIVLTPQGKITAEPTPSILTDAPGTVVAFSGFNRFVAQIDTGVYIWYNNQYTRVTYNGSNLVVVGTVKFLHTHLDIRFVSDGVLYVVPNGSYVASVATLGVYGGPPTSVAFQKMPAVSNGFAYNGRLYICDGEFLKYSENWYYDCWDYGNNYIPMLSQILEGKAISNVVCVLCQTKVVILIGDGPHNFRYTEHDITPLNNSLASGYVEKLGNILVFMASTGIYAVGSDGSIVNLTKDKLADYPSSCKSSVFRTDESYQCVTSDGLYTYDFGNAAVVRNDGTSLIALAKVRSIYYGATAEGVCLYDAASAVDVEFTLPLLDFGESKRKKIRRLRFYGSFLGAMIVTVTGDKRGNTESTVCAKEKNILEVTGFGTAVGKYLKITVTFAGAVFKLERITATAYPIA